MQSNAKRKIDPDKTQASYSFDLRDGYEWCGELVHLLHHSKKNGKAVEELMSYPSLNISSKLTETDSKKIKIGIKVDITIHADDNYEPNKSIGFIDKNKVSIEMHIWLNWNLLHHVHMVLLSGKAEMISIFGTELFNRSGKIHGMHILQKYEKDDER